MTMLKRILILFVIVCGLLPLITECFQRQQQQRSGEESSTTFRSIRSSSATTVPLTTRQDTKQSVHPLTLPWENPPQTTKFQCPCPPEEKESDNNDDNNNIEELGENFFSTLGNVWAEGLLPTSLVFPNSNIEEEDFRKSSPVITMRNLQ